MKVSTKSVIGTDDNAGASVVKDLKPSHIE
jgi:hypothetical protein